MDLVPMDTTANSNASGSRDTSDSRLRNRQPRRGERATSDRDRRILSVAAILGAAVCVYAMRRADPDLWGYLAYGRLFVEQGGLVSSDPFSYTCTGCAWVSFEYLAHILLWQAYHLGGPVGLIGLKCLVGGLCAYALFLAVRATTDDPFVWVPVFLLAISIVARYFLFRPQLFTFAFFAIYIAVLLSYLLGRSNRLWLLPIVMLAWANVHGGFLAGLGALCLALALLICRNVNRFGFDRRLFRDAAHLTLALVASGLVTLVNPQGWRLWHYVLTEVSHDTNRRYIAEWLPTLQAGDVWSTATITLLALILLITGWFAHRSRVVLGGVRSWQWVLSCVPLVGMAFLSVRHIPIAAIWIAPVATLLASGTMRRENKHSWINRVWIPLSSLATVPVILTVVAVSVEPWPRIYVAGDTLGSRHPCESVAFMRNHGFSGNVYAPLWWGSYITWHLFPAVRVSMDGRNISLFPDDMVVENLRFYSANMAEADVNAPLRYDTDYLLVPTDRPVLERVLSDDRWQRVFTGSDSTLFARRGSALALVKPLPRPTALVSTTACPTWMQ
jgi:hypothetical protein